MSSKKPIVRKPELSNHRRIRRPPSLMDAVLRQTARRLPAHSRQSDLDNPRPWPWRIEPPGHDRIRSGMLVCRGLCLPCQGGWRRPFLNGSEQMMQSMTRAEREQELNQLRQADPERLVAAYRTATDTPVTENLPRGMGFPGMIAAILDREFGSAEVGSDTPVVRDAAQFQLQSHRATTLPARPKHCCDPRSEFTAFCSGAAMVSLGLLMAACYYLAT